MSHLLPVSRMVVSHLFPVSRMVLFHLLSTSRVMSHLLPAQGGNVWSVTGVRGGGCAYHLRSIYLPSIYYLPSSLPSRTPVPVFGMVVSPRYLVSRLATSHLLPVSRLAASHLLPVSGAAAVPAEEAVEQVEVVPVDRLPAGLAGGPLSPEESRSSCRRVWEPPRWQTNSRAENAGPSTPARPSGSRLKEQCSSGHELLHT